MRTCYAPRLDDLDAHLDDLDDALAEGALEAAAAALAAAQAIDPDDPEVRYAAGRLAYERSDDQGARAILEALVAEIPDVADPHHALGRVYEALGMRDAQIGAWLRVHALDRELDEAERLVRPSDEKRIARVAEETLGSLPEELASRLSNVAVVITDRPPESLVAEAFDPRAYGLFEGPTDGVDTFAAPTRIVLFVANLVADFGEEEEVLDEQVRTTILHEVGHFFGLDEDEVAALGLA